MKVCIYARVSTEDQGQDVTKQIQQIENYVAENKELELVKPYYIDDGYSGGDRDRPAFMNLKADIKRNMFKVVIVQNQDRIARDIEQFMSFYRFLVEHDVKVYSLQDGWIEMESMVGYVKNTQTAFAHELFRRITSDKIKRAVSLKRAKAVEKGIPLVWGRPGAVFDIDKAIELRKQGLGYKKIAMIVGTNYQSVRRALLKHIPDLNKEISMKNTQQRKGLLLS